MSDLNVVWPLSGGLLIGLSAALYLLLNRGIARISGLTASALGWIGPGISPLANQAGWIEPCRWNPNFTVL